MYGYAQRFARLAAGHEQVAVVAREDVSLPTMKRREAGDRPTILPRRLGGSVALAEVIIAQDLVGCVGPAILDRGWARLSPSQRLSRRSLAAAKSDRA